MEYQKLLLASLSHDVGKFWQGAGEKGTHQELGANFIRKYFPEKWKETAGLVALHHDPGKLSSEGYKLLKIIIMSDWLSSGERENSEDEKIGRRTNESLVSIFSHIDIGKGIPQEKWCIPLKSLSTDENVLFPQPRESTDLIKDYQKLWDDFSREVDSIKGLDDFDKFINSLYYILQKYTWCVPSAVYKSIPDISLFDHLKTTCAISACLYKFHETTNLWDREELDNREQEKFLLIGGDISGIQKYIYDIAAVGVGGVAKRLRARSFYIGMISEVAVQRILFELELPLACNLISSGGRFFIIAPNTEETWKKIEAIRASISAWMLEEFQGNISLNLEYIGFAGKELEISQKAGESSGFSGIFDRMNDALESAKLHKFKEELFSENGWNEKFRADLEMGNICKSCRKMPVLGEEDICEKCSKDEDIGRWLLDAKFLAFSRNEPKHQKYIRFFSGAPYYVSVLSRLDNLAYYDSAYYLILKLNNFETEGKAEGFKLIANHAFSVKDEKEMEEFCSSEVSEGKKCSKLKDCEFKTGGQYPKYLSFDCLSRVGKGNELIGVLKADVDNLGLIFSIGLKGNRKGDTDRDSISRVTSLSRMMDLYFSGWIHQLVETVEEKRYHHCYVVYSGGDDLLIVGPWGEIIDLSRRIAKDFEKFVCRNPNITLSAGAFLSKSRFPIARSSKLADEYLDESKEGTKSQVTLFGQTAGWGRFEELMEYGRFLEEELDKNKDGKSPINPSFVYRLLMYSKMAKSSDLMYMPRMTYDIARNIVRKGEENETERVRRLINMRDKMADMIIPVSYALYKNRE